MSEDQSSESKTELFWDLADAMIASGVAERSTLMGSDCVRSGGEFFAMADHRTGDLIVKLPATRVAALVDAGLGSSFAPAGRVFKEWVSVADPDEGRWRELMAEALSFVTGSG